jgi:Tfp pilus assembly protein PilZ
MIPKPNQRQCLRRTAFIIAEYTVQEGTYRDVIKNIGAGGLFVRTSRKIASGQSITLEFPLFDFNYTVTVSGKVARNSPDGFAVTFNDPIDGLICDDVGGFPKIVHEGDR